MPALQAFGQSDPLVAKSLPRLFSDGGLLWAFSDDGMAYSRIDLFSDPVSIHNSVLKIRGPVAGGLGRTSTLALFFNYAKTDTETVAGVLSLDRSDKAGVDTLVFKRGKATNSDVTSGVRLTALALARDTLALAAGNAGFALDHPRGEDKNGILSGDTLVFQALLEESDTTVAALRCAVNSACPVDTLRGLTESRGKLDSVSAVAIDSAADTTWLLLGTRSGLRRGRLGGKIFPFVPLPGAAGKSGGVARIQVDSKAGLLWVFTGSRYYFSGDHGRSFHVPPKVAGVEADPSGFTGFNPAPEALSVGDTTFINFNLNFPGLVLFRRDTVLANARADSADTLAKVLLDAEDGLAISNDDGKLTTLAVVRNGNATALAVGTDVKGLFYRMPATGGSGAWININSLKRLKAGLEEVITFPTLFAGTTPDGSPEFVHLGYRLKKSGKVTITVYNYAMEKVKTLVRNAPRTGGGGRSENNSEDKWDGRDASGRPVSVGVYYILVESDKGEKGWGKAIAVRGRN